MLKEFEKEAIRILVQGKLPGPVIEEIADAAEGAIKYTGAGYFLSISNRLLPAERLVMNEPMLKAVSGEIAAGLMAFVEDSELTLE